MPHSTFIDRTGQIFGRLLLLKRGPDHIYPSGRKRVQYWVLCSCGKTEPYLVVISNLTRKNGYKTQSCGCLQRDHASQAAKKDLTGKVFGRLVVIREDGRNKLGRVCWLCRCSCGKEKRIVSLGLLNGTTRSCGCLQKEKASEYSFVDLTGQTFGRLTVIEDSGKRYRGKVQWLCKCVCGKDVIATTGSLISGNYKSCGCLQKEKARDNILKQVKSGADNPNWRGGITPLHELVRGCINNKNWIKLVYARDNYTCRCCGDNSGGNLNAHHIKAFSQILEENNINSLEEALLCEELWNVDNGLTLCESCHHKTENYGGTKKKEKEEL